MFTQLLDARIKDLWTLYELSGGLSHPGEKGMLREGFLARVLESILPMQFGIGSGLVVDRWNRQSRQCDLVLYDRRRLPPLLEARGHGIYPIDAVMRMLEVKSTLDKKALEELSKAVWLVHPQNPGGLKIAAEGSLPSGQSYYPLHALYAYNSSVADVTTLCKKVNPFHGTSGFVCIATKGVYGSPDFHCLFNGDVVTNTRFFVLLYLASIESTATSRKEYSLIEWFDVPNPNRASRSE